MPTYEFECRECKARIEYDCDSVVRAIECRKCGGKAERVFSPPTIIQTGYKSGDARYNRGKGK